uniref:MYND-type domain-containing protein n=1 Tax=Panagrolaimus sp. PS1159 TaxID=55785 RepID=A0AC35FYV3_9BILA
MGKKSKNNKLKEDEKATKNIVEHETIALKSDASLNTELPKKASDDPPLPSFDDLSFASKPGCEIDSLLSSKESPLYNIDPKAFHGLQSSYDRVRLFDSPFAAIVMNNKVNKYCSHCMRLPEHGKDLLHCGACAFAKYCGQDCQQLAWKIHKHECKRLNAVFPNLPLTEVMFLSRIIDKVIFLEEYGDKFGWEKIRKWKDLMDHKDDIRNDQQKMEHFEKIYKKMELFRKEEMIEKEKFFDIFCKVSINSHSIHTNAGDEIGMSLDLGVSVYDHSCTPNVSMIFDGFKVYIRPLTQDISPYDVKKSFISYIDVGRSKWQRKKELKAKWYFDCNCVRCSDPTDDILTSIKCPNENCDEPLITSEDADTVMIACPKCKTIADEEYVKAAQNMMKELPARFSTDMNVAETKALLQNAKKYLNEQNIYICRMQTAIFYVTGELEDKMPEMQKTVYENYKRCFPAMDRHNGFQLINIVRTFIQAGDRKSAVPYAYDAMCIFEVCFGMEHPFYLQTLALWTFLDKELDKSDEELYSLMSFDDTRRVNIGSLLGSSTPISFP